MPHDDNENPGKKHPTEQSTNNGDNKVARSAAVFGALELFALVFWMLSEKLHGHWIVHSLFQAIAASCFVCGGAYLLQKAFTHPKVIWSVCCLLCALATFLIFELSVPDSLSLPKLTWAFEDRRFPELRIHLTNEGFFPQIKEGTNVDISAEIALVVPVVSTNELAELRFVVVNDEPHKFVDGGISVWASFSKPLKHSPAGRSAVWRPVQSKMRSGSTVWLEHPFKLKPKTSNPLNDLFLYVPGGWPYPPQEGGLLLNLTTDAGRYPALVAKLMFPVVVKPIAPFVLTKGESNVVVIPE